MFFDARTQRVVKLTKPGLYGARGSLQEYLRQAEYANRKFHDDLMIEGWALMPGEDKARLVVSQSWYAGRLSTEREITAYMEMLGFAMIFDGAWWHAGEEVKVTDALPKNFRTLPGGLVHAIDVLVSWPRSASAIERIENMVYARQRGV